MNLKRDITQFYAVAERHFKFKDTNKLKAKRFKKIQYASKTQKRAGEAILMSEVTDFKTKLFLETKTDIIK